MFLTNVYKHIFCKRFYCSINNKERIFFDSLAKKLKIKHWEEWYSISPQDIRNYGGREGEQVLTKYNNSILKALSSNYKENNWELSKFSKVAPSYWKILSNQRYFLDQIAILLKYSSLKDWYNISIQDIDVNGGRGLIEIYKGSLFSAVTTIYSEYNWEVWRFQNIKIPDEYWNSITLRSYFSALAKHLHHRDLRDFYKIRRDDIEEFGGSFIIEKYFGNSLSRAIMEVFTEFEWKPWLFEQLQVSKGFWQEKENVISFLDWFAQRFQIKSMDDWGKVTYSQFIQNGGKTLLDNYGGLNSLLDKFIFNSEMKKSDKYVTPVEYKQFFTKSQEAMSSFLKQIVFSQQKKERK